MIPASTEIFHELRRTAEKVSAATDRLYNATIEFHGGVNDETGEVIQGVDPQWQDALDLEIIAIEEEAIANAVRPPAQDIRQALARKRARDKNPELYAQWTRWSSEVIALQKWIASKKSVISALQSVLRGERD